MNSSNIPDRATCLELMERYQMLPHIREHCRTVSRVALALAQELNKNGEQLDLAGIEAAALLHDITKTNSLHSRENHAETAAHLLRSLGCERIAQIVAAHISVAVAEHDGSITEEEVVNYADKRVRYTAVVSLNDRFEDLMNRYGKSADAARRIVLLKAAARSIEEKIFFRINRSPDDLPALISTCSPA